MNTDAQVNAISKATLDAVVRKAVRSDTIDVVDWQYQAIHGGGGSSTGGVYRFVGAALDQGNRVTWSLILKIVGACEITQVQSAWDSWEREVLAYESGFLNELPGLTAPRCFGVVKHSRDSVWLWLEDITDALGTRWQLAQYRAAARHLGEFNATYLTRRPIPSYSWLSKDWLRGYRKAALVVNEELPILMKHPLTRRLFPDDCVDRVLAFWKQSEILLEALDRLPQTLCHLDAVRRNLFVRSGTHSRDETVAIDWAFVGTGAVGQDLAALAVGSVLLFEAEVFELPDLEKIALAGYMEGLQATGWTGDERAIWFGYAAVAALRYTMYGFVRLKTIMDEKQRSWAEQTLGHSMTEIIDRFISIREFVLDRADEALKRLPLLTRDWGNVSARTPESFGLERRLAMAQKSEYRDEYGSLNQVSPVHPSNSAQPAWSEQESRRFYLMENPAEGERLESKTDPVAAEAQLRWSGLQPGMSALEVGCGTGAVTRVMARIAAPGGVVGVDQSAVRLASARRLAADSGAGIDFVEGDATSLPFSSREFDYVWSRFLFQYLPNPPAVLAELIRVTRGGGIVTVADLDGQIEQFYPLEASVHASLEEALRIVAETGFDSCVGRKLYHWFHQAGLYDLRVDVLPYQVYTGGLPERDSKNWETKITTAVSIVAERTGERERWERFREDFLAQLKRPGLFYYCTLIVVCGRVPPR